MKKLMPWVKFPAHWIESKGLQAFAWAGDNRSAETSALMCLVVIAHQADRATGTAKVTYDEFQVITSLSREKISDGLQLLCKRQIITRPQPNSVYELQGYHEDVGWCKLPYKEMYSQNKISMFHNFHLRKSAELDALKLFLLIATRRDIRQNITNISYEKIEEYSKIPKPRIKAAISHLTNEGLVYAESSASNDGTRFYHGYRLRGIDRYNHAGTSAAITP